MLNVKLLCVGKLKEAHYSSAVSEYVKRLTGLCRLEIAELPEARLSKDPSRAEIDAALKKEAAEIKKRIPEGAYVIALCVEGDSLSSEELALRLADLANRGKSSLCFVIGSSNGLDGELKSSAGLRLSMSRMTFPHHLARVMLIEQIYRALMINEGSKYHK